DGAGGEDRRRRQRPRRGAGTRGAHLRAVRDHKDAGVRHRPRSRDRTRHREHDRRDRVGPAFPRGRRGVSHRAPRARERRTAAALICFAAHCGGDASKAADSHVVQHASKPRTPLTPRTPRIQDRRTPRRAHLDGRRGRGPRRRAHRRPAAARAGRRAGVRRRSRARSARAARGAPLFVGRIRYERVRMGIGALARLVLAVRLVSHGLAPAPPVGRTARHRGARRMPRLRTRRGAGLAEMIVALTLSAIVSAATVAALAGAERYMRRSRAASDVRRTLREAESVLASELRAAASDSVHVRGDTAVDFLGLVGVSVVCVTSGTVLVLPPDVAAGGLPYSSWRASPETGDVVAVFDTANGGAWGTAVVDSASTRTDGAGCKPSSGLLSAADS